jgi:hypothetical protein
MSAFALLISPAWVYTTPSQTYRTLPYHVLTHIRSFGAWFEPRYIFRAGRLDQ